MKIFNLSPEAIGFPKLDMIEENALEKLLQKCGKYISRIVYNDKYELDLSQCRLTRCISMYCFNITSLDLTASIFIPSDIEILAENCKMIKELKLRFCSVDYERELSKLFEENKNLEDIALYNMEYVCPSLMKLPEHKIKAFTLVCKSDIRHIFPLVSIVQFFSLSS